VDCFSNQLEEKVNGPVMRQKANGKISDWNEYALTCLWNWNTSPDLEKWQMHQLFPFNNPRARHIQLSMSCMSKMFGESSENNTKWLKATRKKKNEKVDSKITGLSKETKSSQQLEQALHRHEYFMTMFPNALQSIGRKLLDISMINEYLEHEHDYTIFKDIPRNTFVIESVSTNGWEVSVLLVSLWCDR